MDLLRRILRRINIFRGFLKPMPRPDAKRTDQETISTPSVARYASMSVVRTETFAAPVPSSIPEIFPEAEPDYASAPVAAAVMEEPMIAFTVAPEMPELAVAAPCVIAPEPEHAALKPKRSRKPAAKKAVHHAPKASAESAHVEYAKKLKKPAKKPAARKKRASAEPFVEPSLESSVTG